MTHSLAWLARVLLVYLALSASAWALDVQTITKLADDDSAVKMQAIAALASTADPAALPPLQALRDGKLYITADGRALIDADGSVIDAATGQPVQQSLDGLEPVGINNRIRGALDSALSAFALFSPDRNTRFNAARGMESSTSESLLTMLNKALEKETDPQIRASLEQTRAGMQIRSADPKVKLAAIKVLGESKEQRTKTLLLPLLEKNSDGTFVEPDADVRNEAEFAVKMIDRRVAFSVYAGRLFAGVSLASILMLAALGLAITYGLLGVINMAHGEMIMIGAYATYVVQYLFKTYAPGWFGYYPLAALPVAFLTAALVGIVLERTVIRWLYGRPLETLLATWGISLS